MLLVPLFVTLVLTLLNTAVAQAERWQPPLRDARIAHEFDFDASRPFTRGARRGVRLAAEPGALVRAPCSGRVNFSGRHPRLGNAISLRCGRLVATELGLARTLVRTRAVIPAGAPIGTLGASGLLHLGARLATQRFGYIDPLTLIGPAADRPTLAPPSRRVKPRRAVPLTRRDPAPTHESAPAPLTAWLGVALAGVGAGLGTTLRVRRRSRRAGDARSRTEWSAIRRRP